MAPLTPRLFVSGAKKGQVIGFAVGEGCMMLLVIYLYMFRVQTLQLHRIRGPGLSFSRILLNLVYLFGVLFTFSAFVLTLVSDMRNVNLCDASIDLCLVFYLGGKVFLYGFMCERLRAIRQGIVDRCADVLWQRCFWGVLIIFGQIAIVGFYYPLDAMNDGHCTIGAPTFITIPMLIFDIGCNLVLSTIFYKQSRVIFNDVKDAMIPPEIKRHFYPRVLIAIGTRAFTISKPLNDMPKTDNAACMMAEIVRKTLVVSICILFSTIVNMVLLIHYNGFEHGWMCFLMCSIDITWNISCLTYLIGLPTSHEIHDEQDDTARSLGFTLSSSFHPRFYQPVNDRHLFNTPHSEIAPAYRMNSTFNPATWAAAGASAAGFCGGPQNFEMDDFSSSSPGPTLRREDGANEWSYERH